MRTVCAVVVCSVSLGCPAGDGGDSGPYMWGAGFKLGTSFIPGPLPLVVPCLDHEVRFPARAEGPRRDGENGAGELDESGDPRFSTLNPVGLRFAARGRGLLRHRLQEPARRGRGARVRRSLLRRLVHHQLRPGAVQRRPGGHRGRRPGRLRLGEVGGDDNLPGGDESLKMSYYPIPERGWRPSSATRSGCTGSACSSRTRSPPAPPTPTWTATPSRRSAASSTSALFPMVGIEADVQFGSTSPRPRQRQGSGREEGRRRPQRRQGRQKAGGPNGGPNGGGNGGKGGGAGNGGGGGGNGGPEGKKGGGNGGGGHG